MLSMVTGLSPDWLKGFSEHAFSLLVACAWQGLLLAGLVWLLLKIAPQITKTQLRASTRFSIWAAAFATVALLPVFSWIAQRASHAIANSHDSGVSGLRLDSRWALAGLLTWLSISVFHAIRLAVGAWKLRRVIRAATSVEARASRIPLLLSSEVDTPSVVGLFRPVILLPAWVANKISDSELKQVVLHETAHVSRRDLWINLVQKLLLTLFPLNPALYWIESRLCFERELACDDLVLQANVSAHEYALCLTALAEQRMSRHNLAFAAGAMQRQSQLGRRVASLLNPERKAGRALGVGLSGASVALLLAGALVLAQSPALVSFAPQADGSVIEAANASSAAKVFPAMERAVPSQSATRATLLNAKLASPLPSPHATTMTERKRTSAKTENRVPFRREFRSQTSSAVSLVPVKMQVDDTHSWMLFAVWQSAAPTPLRPRDAAANDTNSVIPPAPAGSMFRGWLLIQI